MPWRFHWQNIEVAIFYSLGEVSMSCGVTPCLGVTVNNCSPET